MFDGSDNVTDYAFLVHSKNSQEENEPADEFYDKTVENLLNGEYYEGIVRPAKTTNITEIFWFVSFGVFLVVLVLLTATIVFQPLLSTQYWKALLVSYVFYSFMIFSIGLLRPPPRKENNTPNYSLYVKSFVTVFSTVTIWIAVAYLFVGGIYYGLSFLFPSSKEIMDWVFGHVPYTHTPLSMYEAIGFFIATFAGITGLFMKLSSVYTCTENSDNTLCEMTRDPVLSVYNPETKRLDGYLLTIIASFIGGINYLAFYSVKAIYYVAIYPFKIAFKYFQKIISYSQKAIGWVTGKTVTLTLQGINKMFPPKHDKHTQPRKNEKNNNANTKTEHRKKRKTLRKNEKKSKRGKNSKENMTREDKENTYVVLEIDY